MTAITIIKENAVKAYNEATSDEVKNAIKNLIGGQHFTDDLYIAACQKLGKTPRPELEDKSDADEVWADNAIRLATLIKAENMVDGKVRTPVYDGSEYHYWPVPDLSDPSGVGFSYSHCDGWRADSTVGSRFEYFSEDDARAGFEKFKPYYKIHYTK